ncbi:MAG: hypothetical protein AB7L13_11005 [Acidimicrobiia bacterium]
MGEGDERFLTADDDNFHPSDSEAWFEHETSWFWFFIPERKIGCWIYHFHRANIGVEGGGILLFDEKSPHFTEVPYYRSYWNGQLPTERDMRDYETCSGTRIKMLEPLTRYKLDYFDRGRLTVDLDWNAIEAPWAATPSGEPAKVRHLDQFGHVTGSIILHGEEMAVDCYAIRDRTWNQLRTEVWKHGGGGGYTCAAADANTSFLVLGGKQIHGGYMTLDGERHAIVSGTRHLERDDKGYMTSIEMHAVDTAGREMTAIGERVSVMSMPIPGVQGICNTSLVRYTINDIPAWGDDQDFWSIMGWSMFNRGIVGEPVEPKRGGGADRAKNS